MDEESSFDVSSNEDSNYSEESKEDKSSESYNASSSSSEPRASENLNKVIKVGNMSKYSNKNQKLSKIQLGGRSKWRNKLNISRETIIEVDEEHKSDTTNRLSKYLYNKI